MRRKLAAGNWKMNGLSASLGEVEALTTTDAAPLLYFRGRYGRFGA